MAAASLHGPHRRRHRQAWPSARVENPRGGRPSRAGGQRAVREQPPEDGGPATPRHRRVLEGQPVGLLREVGEALLLPSTRDTVRPPGLPSPGTRAHAMPRGRQGLVATDLGEVPAHRQRLLRGRSAVLPHGLPRHPPRRGPPAVPVALPQGLRGRWKRLAAHLRPPRAPQTFLERCCGRRRLPHRPQVLAQREHPGARLVGARAPTARQGGALRFHRRARDEGVLPAPCACSRHPTVVRLDALLWPSGPLALVTRLLQRSCSGRPWRLMRPRDTLERAARRLAPRGLEGLSPRSGHGLLTPQAADRHACRGAPVDPASPAPLPWPAPCGAARDDLELAAAAPAPPHATQHRRSPCGRATGGGGWQRPLGLPALVVLENHVPAAGARRRLQPHDTPRRQWRLPPCPVPGTSRFAHGLGRGAPLDAGSSRAGRGPPLGQTMSTGPWP